MGGGGGGGGGGKCTPLPTDVVLVVPFVPHEVEHRHELDPPDPREAEGEEDEVQILLQLDHGARAVGVDGDVWSFFFSFNPLFVDNVASFCGRKEGRKGERDWGRERESKQISKGGGGGFFIRTREMNRNVSRQDFVDGVDLLEGGDAVRGGFDVDDRVREGGGWGEAGGWGQDGKTGWIDGGRGRGREKKPC